MATFFTGLIIGFVNCWQIALITLATGPFIVAAGGISNIFLHRLAENIQDAYAEAASIAEQVCVCNMKFIYFARKKDSPADEMLYRKIEKTRFCSFPIIRT